LKTNVLNFSGGPGALPISVLEKTQAALESVDDTGVSLLGMSHRSDWYQELNAKAQSNLRELLDIPNDYEVLFLQGGGSLQFAMMAMNFLKSSHQTAQYIVSGYWSAKAPLEAMAQGQVEVIWSGESEGYRRLPTMDDLKNRVDPRAAYLHYVSNETVEGLAFSNDTTPQAQTLICDMSSDLLSKPIEVERYAMIYAHAQKNLGPAGVTVVIIQRALLERAQPHTPPILNYLAHSNANSILNTPPVFSIYVLKLVTDWLIQDIGGLSKMAVINQAKANCLYQAFTEREDFYKIHAKPPHRSLMNIAFSMKSVEQERSFLQLSKQQGFLGLEGHRSIGGLRASLYNAVSLEACEELARFILDFQSV